ncbi:Isonitrile hydratase [Roseibium album]|nr:Isonitrile hydratase [Roseibium album]
MPSDSAKTSKLGIDHHIVLVVFQGTKLLDVAGPLQVFQDARDTQGNHAYRITLASVTGGSIETDTCISLDTVSLSSLLGEPIQTVLVSGGAVALEFAENEPLQQGLRSLAESAERISSICTGAFILAAGGYLSGRKATTHWMHCHALSQKEKTTQVNPDAIFVVDGNLWTSAGVSSGIDMALAMVEKDLGRPEALRLARVLVLYLKRPGGQTQFSTHLQRQLTLADDDLDRLLAWIDENLALTLSVEQLAERAHMSGRNFSRVFTNKTGITPAAYVEQRRVEDACRLLEDEDMPLKTICSLVGFRSEETLRRVFQKSKGVPPSSYAARFGRSKE